MAYLDTSILGAYYCIETTSPAVIRELRIADAVAITPIVELEFTSLLSLKVRTGELDRASAKAVYDLFHRHLAERLYVMFEPDDRDFSTAKRWLARFDTPLRTLDALHLATSLNRRHRLWTTDKSLARAARVLKIPYRLIVA